jgi:hypothetical protein
VRPRLAATALAGSRSHPAPVPLRARLLASPGIRSFVVGTGRRSTDEADVRDKSSEAFDDATFGVLELRLFKGGYSWRFRHAVGAGTFSDSGHAGCH